MNGSEQVRGKCIRYINSVLTGTEADQKQILHKRRSLTCDENTRKSEGTSKEKCLIRNKTKQNT